MSAGLMVGWFYKFKAQKIRCKEVADLSDELHFDFGIDASWEREVLQSIDCL